MTFLQNLRIICQHSLIIILILISQICRDVQSPENVSKKYSTFDCCGYFHYKSELKVCKLLCICYFYLQTGNFRESSRYPRQGNTEKTCYSTIYGMNIFTSVKMTYDSYKVMYSCLKQ